MNRHEQVADVLDRARALEADHDPDSWPAVQMRDITLMSTEIEAMQGLLLWVLWHHQGASSPVGQPIRKFMGIGPHEALTVGQVHHATDVVTQLMGTRSFATGALADEA